MLNSGNGFIEIIIMFEEQSIGLHWAGHVARKEESRPLQRLLFDRDARKQRGFLLGCVEAKTLLSLLTLQGSVRNQHCPRAVRMQDTENAPFQVFRGSRAAYFQYKEKRYMVEQLLSIYRVCICLLTVTETTMDLLINFWFKKTLLKYSIEVINQTH